MDNWLVKTLAAAESLEDPHTWEKFGAKLGQVAPATITQSKEQAFVGVTPIKKRVFSATASFWISLILVGGAYLLIEGVTYAEALNRAIDFLIENIE